MVDVNDLKIRTYEELLWDKVVKMSQAKEEGNDYFFDELLDETEMLLKLVPEMNKVFSENKDAFDSLVSENLQELSKMLSSIEDDITRELINTQKKALIKWEYRSDMLEMLLNLLNYFQMIPFATLNVADMMETVEDVSEPEPEEETEDVPPPPAPPQQIQQPAPQPVEQEQQPPTQIKEPPKQQSLIQPSPTKPKPKPENYPNMGKQVKLKQPKT